MPLFICNLVDIEIHQSYKGECKFQTMVCFPYPPKCVLPTRMQIIVQYSPHSTVFSGQIVILDQIYVRMELHQTYRRTDSSRYNYRDLAERDCRPHWNKCSHQLVQRLAAWPMRSVSAIDCILSLIKKNIYRVTVKLYKILQ